MQLCGYRSAAGLRVSSLTGLIGAQGSSVRVTQYPDARPARQPLHQLDRPRIIHGNGAGRLGLAVADELDLRVALQAVIPARRLS